MSIDISKGVYRAVLAVTATANRVITFPDATDTLAVLNAAQTLAAKTLTGMIVGATDWVTAQHSHAAANSGGTVNAVNATTVTTNANLTGPITSTGNATAIASQTGTGTKFVVDTAPTFASTVVVTGNLTASAALILHGGASSAWATYTPTFAGFVIGNGTYTARWCRLANIVFVQLAITMGSTSTFSGNFTATLPVTASAGSNVFPVGDTLLYDSSAGSLRVEGAAYLPTTTTVGFYITAVTNFNVATAVPWTWATSDVLSANFSYEVP